MNRGGTTSPRAKTAANGAQPSPHTETGVGLAPPKRDFTGAMMRVLSGLAGSELAEKYGLRKPIERVTYQGTKTGFRTLAKATRTFNRVTGGGKPRRLDGEAKNADFFDLSPTEEQTMIVETVREFASEVVRPAAAEADRTASTPPELGKRVAELGISLINVPEEFDGVATHRAAVTNALVAEELSHGDMGLALPLLASNGVAVALTQWGDADQQQTYLPAFTGEHVPQASVVISEPRPLFDPFQLRTTATATPSGYTIEGVKSFVPAPADSELFIVGAQLDGKPTLLLVESDAKGVSVQADPSMGLRGAGLGRLVLDQVAVPKTALLGGGDTARRAGQYADAVRLARLGWAALAVGTSRAVLDYVIPYVNEREAFGEPISHRQAVAFLVANIGIELDGMRLVTLRGAARAQQGLPFAREAALAKKLATDKGMQIGSDGVQLLGGHGYTKDHPAERWYRNLRAIGAAEGVALL